jgi:hypothetical protein
VSRHPFRLAGRAGARTLVLAASLAALAALATPALGQGPRTPEARLAGRLDDATRRQVLVQVDSARSAGLPFDKLVDRALEGASKRAPGPRIALAVRDLRLALGEARLALGRDASAVELEAGASAVQARVAPRVLAGLRRARPDGPLTVPLAVLTDLVAYGVPVDTAARSVLALARAQDATLVAFQRDVERDISVGAVPAAAASLRAGALERSLEATTGGNLNTAAPGSAADDPRLPSTPRPGPRKP